MDSADFPWWALAPFAASALLFGLPHGAVDHLVAARFFCRARPSPACWAGIVAGYLAVAALGLLLWVVHPALAFIAFIALTAYHWGQGELEFASRCAPCWLGSGAHRAAYLMWRGMQPMLLPTVFNAGIYAAVAEGCISLFGESSSVLPDAIRLTGPWMALICVMCWGLEKILAPRATRWSPAKLGMDAALTALFLLVHPLFAIGIYFLAWHAPNHMQRLRLFLGGRCGLSWSRLIWLATPFTLLSLAALGVIGTWAHSSSGFSANWLAI